MPIPFPAMHWQSGTLSLLDGLVSYWKLDEASGSRADAIGGNTLTDVNTVTQSPGKIGFSAQFTAANSERLTHADSTSLRVGASSAEWVGWLYLDTATAAFPAWFHVLAKGGSEYRLQLTDTQFRIQAWFGGVAQSAARALPSVGAWHFFDAYFNAPAQELGIALDGGAFTTQATGSSTMDVTTGPFTLGALDTQYFLNGRLDEIAFYKRVLTSAERSMLYNGGAGTTYPF